MSNLMQIEADFLTSAQVQSEINFQTIFNLQSEVSDAKKSKFDKSLKLAKLVVSATEWFDKSETKESLTENGIEWDTKEVFFKRVFGWQRSYAYKMLKAGKLQAEQSNVVTKFKRACTMLENEGEDADRSIAGLLKFAKAEESGQESEVSREKTFATFSIAKDGLNGDGGFSIRLTESGVKQSGTLEDENVSQYVQQLFGQLAQVLNQQNQNS